MAKVVAFSAGRPNGNTEIYIKTALMEIEKMGIEVELIRLHECDIRPCKDCIRGICFVKGPEGCIIKDDVGWLWRKFMESDGYILGAPVWSLSPCGVVTDFRDRLFGPKMDAAGWELGGGVPEYAKEWGLKYRPGALISVGGALSRHWTSLGMATLFTTTFSAQTNVIDTMDVYQVADMGEALMRQDYLDKARYLGQNLAHAVMNPQKDWEKVYIGDDGGKNACPGCHQNLMIANPGRDYVECAICGRKGFISLDAEGKIRYNWPDDPQDRLSMMGKFDHIREIRRHTQYIYDPKKEEIQEEYQRYKDYKDCIVKPPKKEKE